ncbi:hypothetical protein DDR33_21255 [Pararcticibacter amylolyticus]|uniref:Uncharacterized protein n=1 Tax=Pararcticibacter amylolyticus TaxID=2173175 RepID=A0A2U2PBW5_9SPHI|nr:hypothetical protein DDR33_21255 [Pararcticibacter amylolyticus]
MGAVPNLGRLPSALIAVFPIKRYVSIIFSDINIYQEPRTVHTAGSKKPIMMKPNDSELIKPELTTGYGCRQSDFQTNYLSEPKC